MHFLGNLHGWSPSKRLTKLASLTVLIVAIQMVILFCANRTNLAPMGHEETSTYQLLNAPRHVESVTNSTKDVPASDAGSRDRHKLHKPSCRLLISGDESAIERAVVHGVHYPFNITRTFTLPTWSCTHFKTGGYIFQITTEESVFPLAYSMHVYDNNFQQFHRLLRAIYRPSNFYCIQVDENSKPTLIRKMRTMASCLPNVFISSRQLVGNVSGLEADLVCMKDLLKYNSWTYFLNLSGSEFPLKTNVEIIRTLNVLNGSNVVDVNAEPRRDIGERPPHNMTLYTGSVHVVVVRNFVDYAVNNPISQDLLMWITRTGGPYEMFFATLNHNPHLMVPGSPTGATDTAYVKKQNYVARFENWLTSSSERIPCRGARTDDLCVFGVGDLPLLTSRRELFASKFDIYFQPLTLVCIEQWFNNRTEMAEQHINVMHKQNSNMILN